MKKTYRSFVTILAVLFIYGGLQCQTITFTGGELIGIPTESSIAINIVPASTIELFYEYGTTPGGYSLQTDLGTAASGAPYEIIIDDLLPDTKYYYRMQYRTPGGEWIVREEHSFMTQRSKGSSFVFTVTSDIHDTKNSNYIQAMQNIRNNNADFHIDLGDTFYPNGASSQNAVNEAYLEHRDPQYLGAIGASTPIFLASGNHEEEEGWNLDDTPFSIGVASIQARKAYYPTPVPDGFYTGNTDPLPAIDETTYGNELREDYYAWEWGDALFVVIDEFQYTMDLPYTPAAGEGNNDEVTGDQWSWTLGEQQYTWLKETLENSTAKYKFVFSHNMLGGITRAIVGVGAGYVRGGAEAAAYFEWGGKNADGSEGFVAHRNTSVFVKPIHQLFVENGVSAYFHGHDHQYVYENRDGVVYQEVPSPTMSASMGFGGIYTEGSFTGYQTIKMLENAGYLRISIGSTAATVDYVNSGTGAVSYFYQIEPSEPGEVHTLTMGVDPVSGGSTTPAVGTHTFSNNTEVTITAIPAAGYVFDHWASDVADAQDATTTVTMNSDKSVTAVFRENATTALALDGAVSSGTADDINTIDIPHITGTGSNRMMLVGVSWNCGTTDRTISAVTFTPDEGSALAFSEVITQLANTSSSPRYSAIYSLVNPPNGQTGTVTITFSGNVSNGIMAGVANFAGVNQSQPLGTAGGANGQSTSLILSLTGLTGNELIFDNAFLGASSSSATLTAGSDQTQLWNPGYIANIRGAASTKQAAGSSATMAWTGSSSAYWAITAVPINPAPAGPTYALTMGASPAVGGTTNPSVGIHSFPEDDVVNIAADAAAGYEFVNWTGDVADPNSATTTVAMDDNKTVTANFVQLNYTMTVNADANGSVTLDPSGGTYASGTVITLTPVPNTGFQFSTWSGANAGDIVNTGGVYSIVMNGDKTITAEFSTYVPGSLGLDGAVSSGTADDVSSINISHTTGTGSNRMMLAGVSWNCGTNNRTISSVTFTPDGGSAVTFTEVITQLGYNSSNPRYSAIYSLVNPPSGQTGTVTITFSGSVSNGIMAGVANFAGVNQSQPLGTPGGANGQSANVSVTLTGLTGNELIFDNAFLGASSSDATLTAGSDQTQLWNPEFVSNLREAASTKQATAGSTTMSWTASSSSYWAIAAVPINPLGSFSSDAYNLLLGRPTNNSITVNAIIDLEGDIYYEYGTTPGSYISGQTGVQHVNAGEPVVTVITGLTTNTKYYYRLRFLSPGSSEWASGTEYSFNTQRADNETFSFTLISDSHLGQTFSGNTPARYNQTTLNVAADHPDFHLDLGDAFIMEDAENQTEANAVYLAQRPYFGNFSHSAPVFLAMGNHENEEGWNLDDTPFSTGIGSINARKEYFLNPVTDAFYTGDDSLLVGVSGDQLREDYYAWEWGDALFVVLDPFQYTMTLPYSNVTGSGEANDETVSGDQWNWTLGKKQYYWLKHTLENSTARYKFVFSHHVTGGQLTISNSSAGPATYVRGGAMAANYFEWGGLNANGSDGFESKRPGWNGDPVHQLLVENGVTAYFHGHDHQFVHEEIDGVVYQLVPTPGMNGYGFDLYDSSPYAVSGGNLPDPGHIRVTVSPEEALLEYIRSEEGGGGINGQIAYSYTMEPEAIEPAITVTAPNGGEEWQTGSNHSITWTTKGVIGSVRIEYSTNNGTNWTDVAASTENDGSYTWTIPVQVSENCLLRISEADDGTPADVCDAVFAIIQPAYTLTLSTVGSGAVTLNPGGGLYTPGTVVTLTPVPATDYQFDAWEGADAGDIVNTGGIYTMVMDGNKSVTARFDLIPAINLASPNGGQNWLIGSSHNIAWTSVNAGGTVRIEYSTNNGSNWNNITTSTDNDGSYTWTIPDEPSATCLIRISDTDGDPSDLSDAVFTITSSLARHFIPVWSDNGNNHMNFYALTAKIDGSDLQPGDEIGIFDNTACVGAGILTQILNGEDIYLDIVVSEDDYETSGVIEGYTAGHSATFAVWDASEETEVPATSITYETGYDNIFTNGASSWFHINVFSTVDQTIALLNGWNIFSLFVTPGDNNLLSVVQPLITAGTLVKVQDEKGDAIEYDPVESRWVNEIGQWSNSEGYKIRVNTDATLTVTGKLIDEAVNIPLLSGWNIISYPVSVSQNGLNLVTPLITAGHLTKVQDETGDAIELNPMTGIWENEIGTFDPCEGYKVRVSVGDALTIDPLSLGSGSFLKSTRNAAYSEKSTLKSSSAVHFIPVWSGNGLDHMNIYISVSSNGSAFEPGDEIGIFDGDVCVGSGVIAKTSESSYSFVASADDPSNGETDGFRNGNSISLKAWRPATDTEINLDKLEFITGSNKVFEPMGTSRILVNSISLGLNNEYKATTNLGDVYPNPFSGKTNIPFTLAEETHVDLAVFDMLGNKVRTILHATLSQGSHSLVWEADNNNGGKINPGVYYLKMNAGNEVFVKTLILIKY